MVKQSVEMGSLGEPDFFEIGTVGSRWSSSVLDLRSILVVSWSVFNVAKLFSLV
jgi:hypothetical protein